jgi:predicted sulfurtransferase
MVQAGIRSVGVLVALVILSLIISVGTAQPLISGPLAQTSGDGVRRIAPAEVRELLKKGTAILVDVRGDDSYKAGHIRGALLIPAAEIGERAGELPRDKMIVTYCS